MEKSDSSDLFGVRGAQQKPIVTEHSAFAEQKRAHNGGTFERAKLQSRSPYHRGKPHLTLCDWQEFYKVRQQTKDGYNLVGGILVSRVSVGWDDDHTCFISASSKLSIRVWIEGRRV